MPSGNHSGVVARLVAMALAGSVALALPALALAKHQLIPLDGPNAIGDCLNTDSSPCIQWSKTAQNLSMTVHVYLSDKLSLEEVDLKTDVRNSFLEYNPIAARNPHLQEISTSGSSEMIVTTGDAPFDAFGCVLAATVDEHDDAAPYRISSVKTTINSRVTWNRSLTFSCSVNFAQADARKVINHEMGHAEGLSHQPTGASSIMIQDALSYYHIGAADTNNIQLIYGSYP